MVFPENYSIVIALFPRILGWIYLFAFGAFVFQIKGLLGINGILPISSYLKWLNKRYPKKKFWIAPSLFWINSHNHTLLGVVFGGVIFSILLIAGAPPAPLLGLAFLFYLSIVSTGQDFLSFGWEGFLLEITFNAFFLMLSPYNLPMWISLNILLFRFHLQAGAVKIQSGDKNWRNLTAIAYHYQSQPIPNTIAWYAHKMPLSFHKFCTLLMFFVELVIPFAIFGNEILRLIAFIFLFGLQWNIWFTGNLSYLNHMTAGFTFILVSNQFFPSAFSGIALEAASPLSPSNILCSLVGVTLSLLQLMQLWQHFFDAPQFFSKIFRFLAPFHLINKYGIFAVMTTTRHEVIFEGSHDGKSWEEYEFYHKPSNVHKRPRRISPYQPRVDWQAWFLPLGSYRYDPWFQNFIYHLLKGTKEVIALIEKRPFLDAPPKYIRTVVYEYQFTTFQEKKETNAWWKREFRGVFTHPVSLEDFN